MEQQNEGTKNYSMEVGIHGVSKVALYAWRPPGPLGTLCTVNKKSINVSDEYQRELNDKRALTIAADFRWTMFGVISVARRSDGTLWAFDGATRLAAANRRSDVSAIPCLVFSMESICDEASAFLGANTLRRLPTGIEKHKARVVTSDPNALKLKEILDAYGYKIGNTKGSGSIRAVTNFTKLAALNVDALHRVFHVLAQDLDLPYAHERIVEALWYLDHHDFADFWDKRTRGRVRTVGYDGLLQAANKAAAYYSRGGAAIWAHGVSRALNKGLHKPVSTYQREADE